MTDFTSMQALSGVLLDESALSLDELARACQVEPDWVVRHVEAGVLGADGSVQVFDRMHCAADDLDYWHGEP